MVDARCRFLGAGHYAPIAQAVADAAASTCASCGEGVAVEAGAGTGYYLSAVLDAMPHCSGLALDVSKAALRRAAKAHLRCAAVLCDVWRKWPVADAAASLALSVFAPRNAAEFDRVLRPDGALIVVTPTVSHLAELVGRLGLLTVDPGKEETVAGTLHASFRRLNQAKVEFSLQLSHQDVKSLVSMGPSAWHLRPENLAGRISELPEKVSVTASVHVTSFRAIGRG